MNNDYNITLKKERDEGYTVIYGDIGLPEEIIYAMWHELEIQKIKDYKDTHFKGRDE